MATDFKLEKKTIGAWVIHHGQKTSATTSGAAEFSAIDAAGKAAGLLSQLSRSDQVVVDRNRLETLVKAASLNPKVELPGLLEMLSKRRLISMSSKGDVEILGLTTGATTSYAADLFEDQNPSNDERATIFAAELSSRAPILAGRLIERVGDEFKLTKAGASDLIGQSERIGFVDAEGAGSDKLVFNGNLFRRDTVSKTKRILDSLSSVEEGKVKLLAASLDKYGCATVQEAKKLLGDDLFSKLHAAGMYDVNVVVNPTGEFAFVTNPSAFHKFNDPMADDSFDLAKALVAALFFGMTQSDSSRGKITMLHALLQKLVRGDEVGPATAIGEDYQVLETKGVIGVRRGEKFGWHMKLHKKDIGEMALSVLTIGEAATTLATTNLLPGKMTGFAGPERSRSAARKKQLAPSRRHTQDVLNALRTSGGVGGRG